MSPGPRRRDPEGAEGTAAADSRPDMRPVRVLLVEDSATDVMLVRGTLERSTPESGGSSVELTDVHCAEDALELLASRGDAFDVVVTDHRLPGMQGLEL
ncbi:MAG: response regulator, partial [Holophagales bacterium]|nr:response regulator [Holophagales bacterium]